MGSMIKKSVLYLILIPCSRVATACIAFSVAMLCPTARRKIFTFSIFKVNKSLHQSNLPILNHGTDKILGHQSSILESFKQQETRQRHKKSRVRKNVDDKLRDMRSKFTEEATKNKIPDIGYWKSGNTMNLLHPSPG